MYESFLIRALILLIVCASAEPVAAQVPSAADARKQIEANYRRENAALQKEDVAGVLVHYDKNYRYHGPKGRVYRTPELQPVLVEMFRLMSGIRASTKIQRFALRGKEASVRVIERVDAVMKDPSTRKTSKVVVAEDRDDVWKLVNRAWIKKSSRSLKLTQTLDGKPIPF